MALFIISDTHFHHKNILDFEPRPFNSVEEMNEVMVENWNKVVMKNDTVYHLGDLSFGKVDEWRDVLNRLHGKIILTKGNHDKSKIVNTMINEGLIHEYHPLGTVLKMEKMILNMSHYPMLIGARPLSFSIHGHLHSKTTGYTNHVNIGADSDFILSFNLPFGTPIKMDDLIAHLHELNPILEEEREQARKERGL